MLLSWQPHQQRLENFIGQRVGIRGKCRSDKTKQCHRVSLKTRVVIEGIEANIAESSEQMSEQREGQQTHTVLHSQKAPSPRLMQLGYFPSCVSHTIE